MSGRLVTVAAALLVLLSTGPSTAADKLIYLALWRGCEAACEALKDELERARVPARVVERNADRDRGRLPGFVAEARELDVDLVVTWGTSVTRGMLGSLDDTGDEQYLNDRPAVFMVVADPIGAGLIEGYDRTGRPNVTGTRNRVPEAVNINVIRSYQPDFRRLGMVFNRSERNSVLKVEEMRRLAEREGFDVVAIEVRAGTDGQPRPEAIAQALEGLRAAQVDFVYTGSSSFLRRHQDTFTAAAIELGLPVLSAYESMVRQSGALISVAARYRDVGRLAGEQVRRILVDGAVPGELPVAAVTDFAYVVNMETARRIRLLPPLHVLEIVETVH